MASAVLGRSEVPDELQVLDESKVPASTDDFAAGAGAEVPAISIGATVADWGTNLADSGATIIGS